MSRSPSVTRDIVCVGCSAGGVETLPRLLAQLPQEFSGAVFIVQHMAVTENPYLVEILRRQSQLPVGWAEQGERIVRGRVYVAPPDVHLMFTDDHLRLARTARENHSRPSIDKMFRSAAVAFGSRAIGVLLTGMLDDGVAGLRAIRESGGVVIVQDPDDAMFPELPGRALLAMQPDRTLPVEGIALAVRTMIGQPVPTHLIPERYALEARMDHDGKADPADLAALGEQATVACPECSGPMWTLGDEKHRRYRCYNGHVTSARELIEESANAVETALWSALRALSDRATTLELLAQDAQGTGNGHSADAYGRRAREARAQAEVMRKFLFDLGGRPSS